MWTFVLLNAALSSVGLVVTAVRVHPRAATKEGRALVRVGLGVGWVSAFFMLNAVTRATSPGVSLNAPRWSALTVVAGVLLLVTSYRSTVPDWVFQKLLGARPPVGLYAARVMKAAGVVAVLIGLATFAFAS